MIIKDISNWKHIDLIKIKLPNNLCPNGKLEVIWIYNQKINEIFYNKQNKEILSSIYILIRIEIKTKNETLSAVNTYEFKKTK